VKNLRIKSLILVSVIMMSFITTSANLFDHILDNCELIENSGEEEQNEEKESKDFLKEFTTSTANQLISNNGKMSLYYTLREQHLSSIRDVLTPPPEFI
jgi:hypothetical protein